MNQDSPQVSSLQQEQRNEHDDRLDNLEEEWTKLMELIRPKVGEDAYQRWFKDTGLSIAVESSQDEICLQVPNEIHQFWIESNYGQLISEALEVVFSQPKKVIFQIVEAADVSESGSQVASAEKGQREFPEEEQKEENDSNSPEVQSNAGENELFELRKNSTQPTDKEERVGGELFSKSNSSEFAEGGAKSNYDELLMRIGINPRYNFANFVVGGSCQFANAAAQAVSENPGKVYNPLFLYGGVGLGKTHLMQAIGQAIQLSKKKAKVVYMTSEEFTNQFIDGLRTGSLVKFRRKYRGCDALLIDDIQFFEGKESTQEEFFHTFNHLFDGHKQIVMTSDRPPSEIGNLEKRLVSRFEWGLTAELLAPDMETRLAILGRKRDEWKISIPDEILAFLAENIRSNVRRLEGALLRVASFGALSSEVVTLEKAKHLLRDFLREEAPKRVSVEQIQKVASEKFDIRFPDMSSRRRTAPIAFARQVAMYMARKHTALPLKEIGDAFGGKDHGTVIYAVNKISERLESDDELSAQVAEMVAELGCS